MTTLGYWMSYFIHILTYCILMNFRKDCRIPLLEVERHRNINELTFFNNIVPTVIEGKLERWTGRQVCGSAGRLVNCKYVDKYMN